MDKALLSRITIVYHYPTSDEDCGGDYYDIEILNSKGRVIAEFGDAYHESVGSGAEGFIMGLEFALGKKIKTTYKNVADREDY